MILLLASAMVLPLAPIARGQDVDWIRQFGTGSTDFARAIVDASGVYVVGFTDGTLPSQTSAGGRDAFVRKYNPAGSEVWTRQFGSGGDEDTFGISAFRSGVYVVGFTDGTLPGQTSAGGKDAFVRKYNPAGNEVWTRQFGSGGEDLAAAIAVDASGVYVAGSATQALPGQTSFGNGDAFVRNYDASGTEVWTRQFGTGSGDIADDIAVDASGVYVAGGTHAALPGQTWTGGQDAFVRKYDAAGNEIWTDQFGPSLNDEANGISVDASGVYVVGRTDGTLPFQTSAGGADAFVRKYDAAGNEIWTDQFGTGVTDTARKVSVDASGVYVVGVTDGTLPGQTSAGNRDGFVRKYDAAGTEIWTRQFGTGGSDEASGISHGPSGLYVAGGTDGTFPGQTSAGGFDAFVVKFEEAGS